MSKKPDYIWCPRTLVELPFHYALCITPKSFNKILKQIKLPKSEWPEFLDNKFGACVYSFKYKGKYICIVNIAYDPETTVEEVYALLCHEAVHIWQRFRDYIGEQEPSTEFEAYSLQSIAQSLMESYKNQTSTKKGRK